MILLLIICIIVISILLYFGEVEQPRKIRKDYGVPVQVGGLTVEKLVLNPDFAEKEASRPGIITKFYKEQLQRTEKQTLEIAEIEDGSDNIATLNVHMFQPINLEHDDKEVLEAPLKFMRRFNVSTLVMQEVPISCLNRFTRMVEHSGLHHSASDFDYEFQTSLEPLTNLVVSRYPIVVERRLILPTEDPYLFRHRHVILFRMPTHPRWPNKLFATTHLEVAESLDNDAQTRIRKQQLHAIFKQNPDFILGDMNFAVDTPEYKLALKNYCHGNINYNTTPFETTVDYIFYRKRDPKAKWNINTYSVNYPWSDHRPVIGVYVEN